MFSAATEISMLSGMLSAGAISSSVCSTSCTMPPRLMPGDSAWPTTWIGTSTRMVEPAVRRRKSTWTTVSFTGSSW